MEIIHQQEVNIITDTLPGQEDSLFTKFTVGSYGKFEGALSGTKTADIFSITGNTNFISQMVLEEITHLVREMVALNLKDSAKTCPITLTS